jgi:hypothetical protein
MTDEKPQVLGKETCPIATLSTANPTRAALGQKPCFLVEKILFYGFLFYVFVVDCACLSLGYLLFSSAVVS